MSGFDERGELQACWECYIFSYRILIILLILPTISRRKSTSVLSSQEKNETATSEDLHTV